MSLLCPVFPTLSNTKGQSTVFLLCLEFLTLSVSPTVCRGDSGREGIQRAIVRQGEGDGFRNCLVEFSWEERGCFLLLWEDGGGRLGLRCFLHSLLGVSGLPSVPSFRLSTCARILQVLPQSQTRAARYGDSNWGNASPGGAKGPQAAATSAGLAHAPPTQSPAGRRS